MEEALGREKFERFLTAFIQDYPQEDLRFWQTRVLRDLGWKHDRDTLARALLWCPVHRQRLEVIRVRVAQAVGCILMHPSTVTNAPWVAPSMVVDWPGRPPTQRTVECLECPACRASYEEQIRVLDPG